jgi:hypothetical protein
MRKEMYKKQRSKDIEYELERSINNMIERKMRKANSDLNSLILGASNKMHSNNVSDFSADAFGQSSGQMLSSLASMIQKNILRNL